MTAHGMTWRRGLTGERASGDGEGGSEDDGAAAAGSAMDAVVRPRVRRWSSRNLVGAGFFALCFRRSHGEGFALTERTRRTDEDERRQDGGRVET